MVSCRNPRERYSGTFRTRESRLPVARTIVLDAKNCKLPLIIRQSGSPDGYIRYTAAPGFVLDAGFDCEEAIRIDEADYIILDQLTVRGGRYYGINLLQSGHVVIRRCDISGFGAPGVRREGDGKYLLDNRIVYDLAGIRIKDSGELLIEHNLIHSPQPGPVRGSILTLTVRMEFSFRVPGRLLCAGTIWSAAICSVGTTALAGIITTRPSAVSVVTPRFSAISSICPMTTASNWMVASVTCG
ncbi:MAG: right-handed parallel beta-helix repeat-containing protein [Lentisphaeria bacterium]|nr:MAG: right-handed parallel beta-helix repeat-containing protein [Lentisphaeria bacterium]